jgi:hypothetical protein
MALAAGPSRLEGVGDSELADGEGRGEQQPRSDQAHQPAATFPAVDRRQIFTRELERSTPVRRAKERRAQPDTSQLKRPASARASTSIG